MVQKSPAIVRRDLRQILYNAENYLPLGVTVFEDELIRANGWQIVNAHRPVPGSLCWKGPYKNGTFYAAGSPDADNGYLGRVWKEDGAWPVRLISNEEVEQIIADGLMEQGSTLAEGKEEFGGIDVLAQWYDLPYRKG